MGTHHGGLSSTDKKGILDSQGFRCAYCDVSFDGEHYQFDHIVPAHKIGLTLRAIGNMVACCPDCNRIKGRNDFGISMDSIKQHIHTIRKAEGLPYNQSYIDFTPPELTSTPQKVDLTLPHVKAAKAALDARYGKAR